MTPASFEPLRPDAPIKLHCRETVSVAARDEASTARARELARRLELPLCAVGTCRTRFLLLVGTDALALDDVESGAGELCADWTARDVGGRIRGGRRQLLPRAAGLHRHRGVKILDACAGLGTDGFVLACLGADVVMTERHPVVFALLQDAFLRAVKSGLLPRATVDRVNAECMDACNWLRLCPKAMLPDVVYLDPMYPESGKTALPTKNMQMLRALLGGQAQSLELLMKDALSFARRRVVVKRPARSRPLAPSPDFSHKGKQIRYDVYLVRRGENE